METDLKFLNQNFEKIFIEEDRFGFEPEFTIKLAKQKIQIL